MSGTPLSPVRLAGLMTAITNALPAELTDEDAAKWEKKGVPALQHHLRFLIEAAPEPRRKHESRLLDETTHLRLIETVDLPGTSGMVTIAQSGEVFKGHVDLGFGRKQIAAPSHDTLPAKALVYEMTKDGTYDAVFSSLGSVWQQHLLTEGQIVAFCTQRRDQLRQAGHNTFFPFKVEGPLEVFVAAVTITPGTLLKVRCWPFENHAIWDADHRPRLVLLK